MNKLNIVSEDEEDVKNNILDDIFMFFEEIEKIKRFIPHKDELRDILLSGEMKEDTERLIKLFHEEVEGKLKPNDPILLNIVDLFRELGIDLYRKIVIKHATNE